MSDEAVWSQLALVGAGGVIAGASTLLATALSSRGEQKRLAEKAALDSQAARRTLRRQQQEEVFVLAEKWARMYISKLDLRTFVMRGELTFNEMLDQEIERGSRPQPDYARMDMLIRTQLRELEDAWREVGRQRRVCNAIMDDHKRRYRKDPSPDLAAESDLIESMNLLSQSILVLQSQVTKMFVEADDELQTS